MTDNRSYNFKQSEKMNRLDGLTTKEGEEDPWADIDEVINIGRKAKLQSPRRDDTTKGIIAQRQDCVVTKQTITSGIVSTSQPFNGLISGIASSLPDVEKILVPSLPSQPIADKGFEMTGTPKGNPSHAMDSTVSTPVEMEEEITSNPQSSYESDEARNNGGRPTFAVNVQPPTVNASFLPDEDILDAPSQSARSLIFEMTGPTEASSQTIDAMANAQVDNNDPRSIDKLDSEDSYSEDYTFVVNTDNPTGRNSISRTPELDSQGRQEHESNTEEETPKISQDLKSGAGEYNKEKDMNTGSWLDRVPGEEIIDITARSKKVYTPYLIQQREKRMAAVRQQARQRYADRKINNIAQATVPTIPSRPPNNKKNQDRYCFDILNDEERCQSEEHRPTEERIRAAEQYCAEERRKAERYHRAEEYFSSIPAEYVEQWSKDCHISAYDYRQLACIAYSHPRTVTSATATREDRARLLKASNDRRAQARAAVTELPSETTWCVGYNVANSSNRSPSPAYFPGRYIIENHPDQENKSSRLRFSKKRSATVIQVVPRGGRNSDNNTKTGPFRRGLRALRNGLRRVRHSLQELMTACTCSSCGDTDL